MKPELINVKVIDSGRFFEKLNWFAYNLQIYIFVLFVPGGSMQVAQKYFRLVTKENSW